MNFKDTALPFLWVALNVALLFIFCGLVAHCVWHLVSFGWNLV